MAHFTVDLIYNKLIAALKVEDLVDTVSKEFSQQNSDEDRAKLVLNLPSMDKVLCFPTLPGFKSSDKSVEYRTLGNQQFQKKKMASALTFYTKSIAFAPQAVCGEPELLDFSLGLGNRSAALYHLKEYKLCLDDIDMALDKGYPKHLHHKVYERRGKCLLQLGDSITAKKSFQNAIDSIVYAKGDIKSKNRLENTIQQLITSCTNEHDYEQNNKHACSSAKSPGKLLPHLTNGKHKIYQSLTSACDVSFTEHQGRFITANRDIKPGEVILVEKPYASVLLEEQIWTHCDCCYEHTMRPIPCDQCPSAMYCSESCRTKAWTDYHEIECKILALIFDSGVGKFGHLALRTITKSSLDNLLKFRQTMTGKCALPKEVDGCSESGKYLENDYNAIYHLVTHDKDRAVHDLFRRAVTAAFLVKCLKHVNFFNKRGDTHDVSERECEAFIGGLILSHLQLMPCNAHEINELELDPGDVAQSPLVEVGAGIYSTLSLFNHSCDPTANRNFFGDVCVVRAIKLIPRGHEVSDNYGAVYAVQPLEERINKLTPQYYFTCQCEACVNNWPLLPEINSDRIIWKCQKCGTSLSSTNGSVCQKCKSHNNVKELERELKKSQLVYKTAFDKLLACEVDEAETGLCTHLELLQKCVVLPWLEYNSCQEALKQCFSIKANCFKSYKEG